MRTEVDLDTGELVTSQWVLRGRVNVPSTRLRGLVDVLVKFSIIRVAQLNQFSLVADNVARHQRVDPVRGLLIDLDIFQRALGFQVVIETACRKIIL